MNWSLARITSAVFVYAIFFFFAYLEGVDSVRIRELKVPHSVENGTTESIVLDCDYELGNESPKGLVVKWFFNRNSVPVYQWIYGHPPKGFGILKNRLNFEYVASNVEWEAHRALNIKNPTTEFSGDWLCRVSTWESEAFKVSKMIVYAPVKDMDIKLMSRPSSDSINVSCTATGAFPEPKLSIVVGTKTLEDVYTDSSWNDGAFDVEIHKVIRDDELETQTLFDCELKIPNTSYTMRKSFLYGGPMTAEEDAYNTASLMALSAWHILATVAIWCIWIAVPGNV